MFVCVCVCVVLVLIWPLITCDIPLLFKRALCERFPLNCVLKNVHISKEQRRGLEEVQLYWNRWGPLSRVRHLSSTLYMEPGERMICAEAPIETFIWSGLVVKILSFLSNCSSCTKLTFSNPCADRRGLVGWVTRLHACIGIQTQAKCLYRCLFYVLYS